MRLPFRAGPALLLHGGLYLQLRNDQVAAGGAVLVFLPGAPEIAKAARALQSHEPLLAATGGPMVGGSDKWPHGRWQ